jgi:hypothetical protein
MDSRADRIAIFIAFGAVLLIAAICALDFVYFDLSKPDPESRVPIISPEKAEAIALEEVKQREGWSGKADEPSSAGSLRIVAVRRKPGSTSDWRSVTVNRDGSIVNYVLRTDPLP